MNESDHIGEYVTRVRGTDPMTEDPMTKAHHIESRIDERYVTHCGRQIGSRSGSQLQFDISVSDERRCQRCD